MREQRIKIKVLQGLGKMIVRRRTGDGDWGTKERWKIGEKSNLPRALFFNIKNFVRQKVRRCAKKRDYASLRGSVVRALCEAAESCGCAAEFGKEGADVVWYLQGIPLIGFHIAKDESITRAVEQLLAGKTVFRWTIALSASGYFHIRARTTNPRYRFDAPRKEGKHPFVDGHWLRQGRGV